MCTHRRNGGDDIGEAKDKFVKEFEKVTGKSASGYRGNPKGFAVELNAPGREALRALFREAVRPSPEDEAAAGLSLLFSPT